MDFKESMVVLAKAGRDAGSCYWVVRCEGGYCWIADGHRRKISSPKKKNPRHLAATNHSISREEVTSDRALRRKLAEWNTAYPTE